MKAVNLIGAVVQGIVLVCIAAITNISVHALIGAHAAAAIFMAEGNGANFAVVPHIYPARNGIVSGLTGAAGNLGGIVFSLVFRFDGMSYHKAYRIIGIIGVVLPLSVSWIRVPKVAIWWKFLIISATRRARLVRKTSSWPSINYKQDLWPKSYSVLMSYYQDKHRHIVNRKFT